MLPQNKLAVTLLLIVSAKVMATPRDNYIQLGFANIQTVSAVSTEDAQQHLISGIIVRIYDKGGKREVFTISNEAGIALVPLRPGNYCYEAFASTGNQITDGSESKALLSSCCRKNCSGGRSSRKMNIYIALRD
jgi:hypothetical protein